MKTRRPMCAVLAAAGLLALTATPAMALCGDCNADNLVDVLDALQAAQAGASLLVIPPGRYEDCNVQGTVGPAPGGTVDILDSLKIAQFSAGLPRAMRCDDPVVLINCNATDTHTLTVGPQTNPPALATPGSTQFYSYVNLPPTALSVEFAVSFQGPSNYDLLVGDVGTIPGDTTAGNYVFQSRISNPEVVVIDANTTPSINDYIQAGQPIALAVHLFANPGASYTLQVTCTLPIPPSVINVPLASTTPESTTAASGPAGNPDFLITGSTHWFVLNSFGQPLDALEIFVDNISGDHDLYLARPGVAATTPYSIADYPRSSQNVGAADEYLAVDAGTNPDLAAYGTGPLVCVVTAVTPGNFSLRITGYRELPCGGTVSASLATGTSPNRGQLTSSAATRYYRLSGFPANTVELVFTLTGTSATGDVDLYIGDVGTFPGDPTRASYVFDSETAGTSDEIIVVDANTTPDVFTYVAAGEVAVAISAFELGDVDLTVDCNTGQPPPPTIVNIGCGGSDSQTLTTPSGMPNPPPLALPGSTIFYCLNSFPAATGSVEFRVTGSAGSNFVLLIGGVATACGETDSAQYAKMSQSQQSPTEEVTDCTIPSLVGYGNGPIAAAVHWVSGGNGQFTINVQCNAAPFLCAPEIHCGDVVQGQLSVATNQLPPVNFTPGLDTDFYMLYPVPENTSSITISVSSPNDPDADYDLFVGGPSTPPCATNSSLYPHSSTQGAGFPDTVTLTGAEISQFGCNPIPIAVYYYRDLGAPGGYVLSVTCQ